MIHPIISAARYRNQYACDMYAVPTLLSTMTVTCVYDCEASFESSKTYYSLKIPERVQLNTSYSRTPPFHGQTQTVIQKARLLPTRLQLPERLHRKPCSPQHPTNKKIQVGSPGVSLVRRLCSCYPDGANRKICYVKTMHPCLSKPIHSSSWLPRIFSLSRMKLHSRAYPGQVLFCL